MMELRRQDAEAMLHDAGVVESAVRARSPQEHSLYFAMALGFVCCGLFLDLGGDDGAVVTVAVAVLAVVFLAVLVGTHVPYARRYRQVRVRRTPMWVEWALAGVAAASLFLSWMLLDDVVRLPATVGGVMGAVPFVLWAERLRRTA